MVDVGNLEKPNSWIVNEEKAAIYFQRYVGGRRILLFKPVH